MEENNKLIEFAKKVHERREETFKLEDEILKPLLPEINLITSGLIKEFVRSVLFNAPPSFWDMPACWNDFNPPDERVEGGQILHIKRSIRCYRLLADAKEHAPEENNYGIAALLIKDVLKGGYTRPDVGRTVRSADALRMNGI